MDIKTNTWQEYIYIYIRAITRLHSVLSNAYFIFMSYQIYKISIWQDRMKVGGCSCVLLYLTENSSVIYIKEAFDKT